MVRRFSCCHCASQDVQARLTFADAKAAFQGNLPIRLAAALIALYLCRLCHADMPREVEQLVLAQNWEQARQVLVADKSAPNDPIVALLLAYACLMTSDYRAATEQFSKGGSPAEIAKLADYAAMLAQKHPQNAVAQMLTADALARSGKYDDALRSLNGAVHVSPRSAALYDVRGVVYALAGKTEGAIADFVKAIELDSNFADAYVNRGLLYFWRGDTDAAINDLNKAAELAPEFPLAYNSRAQLAFSIEDWETALADFETAGKLAPGVGWIHSNIRLALWAKAQADLSREVTVMGSRGTTLCAQSLVIDGAGVGSAGAAHRQAWARELLGDNYVQINVRHEGSAPRALPIFGRNWPVENNVITLPRESDSVTLDKQLKPLMQKAWVEGKSVYLNIDANLTLPGYLVGLRTKELGWAASVADYALGQTPANAHKIFSGHSAFTDVPQYMSEKGSVQNWILQSPRNYNHMAMLLQTCPQAHFDLVTGDGDAPHVGQGLHHLKAENVRILDLQKPGVPTPLDFGPVHSKVGQPSTRGTFKITTAEGTVTKQGRLGSLVSEPLTQVCPRFVSLADSHVPNYWVSPNSSPTAADALVSMVNTGSRMPLTGDSSPLPRHAVVAGNGEHAQRMIKDFRDAGWKVTHMPEYKSRAEVDAFAKQIGATRITGVMSGTMTPLVSPPTPDSFDDGRHRVLTLAMAPSVLSGDDWKKRGPASPSLPPGATSLTPTNYRLPTTALQDEKRGGVAMKADIVKGQPADTSEMFGVAANTQRMPQSQQQGLVCPFLIFCTMPSEMT